MSLDAYREAEPNDAPDIVEQARAREARRAALDALDRARTEPPKPRGHRGPLPGLSSAENLLLRILVGAGGAEPQGCYLGPVKLCRRANFSRRTLDRTLASAIAKGWIGRTYRTARHTHGAYRYPVYHVTPVQADLMTDAELEAEVEQDRAETAARKRARKATRREAVHANVTGAAPPSCPRQRDHLVPPTCPPGTVNVTADPDLDPSSDPDPTGNPIAAAALCRGERGEQGSSSRGSRVRSPGEESPEAGKAEMGKAEPHPWQATVAAWVAELLPHMRDPGDVASVAIRTAADGDLLGLAETLTAIRALADKRGPDATRADVSAFVKRQNPLEPDEAGKVLYAATKGPRLTIGSAETADLRITDDPTVPPTAATIITAADGRWVLRPSQPAGVEVVHRGGPCAVIGPRFLRPGAHLLIGDTIVRVDAAPGDTRPQLSVEGRQEAEPDVAPPPRLMTPADNERRLEGIDGVLATIAAAAPPAPTPRPTAAERSAIARDERLKPRPFYSGSSGGIPSDVGRFGTAEELERLREGDREFARQIRAAEAAKPHPTDVLSED